MEHLWCASANYYTHCSLCCLHTHLWLPSSFFFLTAIKCSRRTIFYSLYAHAFLELIPWNISSSIFLCGFIQLLQGHFSCSKKDHHRKLIRVVKVIKSTKIITENMGFKPNFARKSGFRMQNSTIESILTVLTLKTQSIMLMFYEEI